MTSACSAAAPAVGGRTLRAAVPTCFCGADAAAAFDARAGLALIDAAAATLLDEAASTLRIGAARARASSCLSNAIVVACSRSCCSSFAIRLSLASSLSAAEANAAAAAVAADECDIPKSVPFNDNRGSR